MTVYYSAKERGFYLSEINDWMPKDAIEITPEEHEALLVGQTGGKLIMPDGSGRPVLQEQAPPSLEQLTANERKWRDAEVLRVSWLRDRHRDQLDAGIDTTLTTEQFGALLAYIQNLRDWPQSPDFPDSLYRPTVPGWIVEQAQ